MNRLCNLSFAAALVAASVSISAQTNSPPGATDAQSSESTASGQSTKPAAQKDDERKSAKAKRRIEHRVMRTSVRHAVKH